MAAPLATNSSDNVPWKSSPTEPGKVIYRRVPQQPCVLVDFRMMLAHRYGDRLGEAFRRRVVQSGPRCLADLEVVRGWS